MIERYGFKILSETDFIRLNLRSEDRERDASMMKEAPDINKVNYCKYCGSQMLWFVLVSDGTRFDTKSGEYNPICEVINVCPKSSRNPHGSWLQKQKSDYYTHDYDSSYYFRRNELIEAYTLEVYEKLSKAKPSFFKNLINSIKTNAQNIRKNNLVRSRERNRS